MRSFCLIGATLFAAAGCRGPNVEGAWEGDLPLQSGENCRILLQSGQRLTFVCPQDPQWYGGGSWSLRDGVLELRIAERLAKMQAPNVSPVVWRWKAEYAQNVIRLQAEGGGPPIQWKRRAP